MKMKYIKIEAKKRRAKLLAQLSKFDSITELAEFHGVTRSRMSSLLIQARIEANIK
jgi:hypothetical protein